MKTRLFVRNKSREVEHQLDELAQFDAIMRESNPGTWTIEAPPTDAASLLATAGSGLVSEYIVDKDTTMPLISGPTTQIERVQSDEGMKLLISGVSDDALLWDRLVFPSKPNFTAPLAFAADDYDVRSGVAESLMHAYTQANAGSGPWARPIDGLSFATDEARGSVVYGRGRFQLLGDLLRDLGLASTTRLRFGITDLRFYVTTPVDRRLDAVFSVESGNVASISVKTTAPVGTHGLGAGGGEGVNRMFVYYPGVVAAAKWNREIEWFRDRRDTTDPNEIADTLRAEKAEKAEKNEVTIRPIDVPGREFAKAYGLGDLVTAADVEATISEIHITANGDGETVEPALGSLATNAASTLIQTYDRLRDLKRRVIALERSL